MEKQNIWKKQKEVVENLQKELWTDEERTQIFQTMSFETKLVQWIAAQRLIGGFPSTWPVLKSHQ